MDGWMPARDQKSVKWAGILRTVKPVADHWRLEAVASADLRFGNGSCIETAKQDDEAPKQPPTEWDPSGTHSTVPAGTVSS